MTWLDAIELVLKDADEPLHYGEVAARIARRRLVATKSNTPDITAHASVSLDIRRRLDRGLPPRFTMESGTVGLAEWSAPSVREAQEAATRLSAKAKRDLLTALRGFDGENFEGFLEVLLIKMGYEVEVTAGGGDDGVDMIAEATGGLSAHRVGVQAKCLGSNREVGPNTVRLLRDALSSKGCTAGAIISTARFNDDARRVADEPGKPPIQLVGPDELADLAAQFGVGIAARRIDLLTADIEALRGGDQN